MAGTKSAQADVLVVKAIMRIPQQNSTGLLLTYFDSERLNNLGHFSAVALGQELAQKSTSMTQREFAGLIQRVSSSFELNNDLHTKLKFNCDSAINQEFIKSVLGFVEAHDPGSAENLYKRLAEKVFGLGKIEVRLDWEYISQGEFSEFKVEEEIEKTTLSQRIQTVLPYAGGKNDLAEKIVKENPRDVALVKFSFSKGDACFGSGILIYSVLIKSVMHVSAVAGSERDLQDGDLDAPALDFFRDLSDIRSSGSIDAALSSRVEKSLASVNTSQVGDGIEKDNRELLAGAVSRALSNNLGGEFAAKAGFEMMNSLRMEMMLKPGRAQKQDQPEEPQKEEDFRGLKVVGMDLILSPSTGRNISSLKPGDNIQVLLNASNPISMKIIKGLNLMSGNKVKPIGAMVYSIKHSPKTGYRIYVKIVEGVLGKAEEEQDVRIKMGDPVVEEAIGSSRSSMMIGIIAGGVVLAIIAILFLILR